MPDEIPPSWFVPGAPPLEVDFGCHRGIFLLGMSERYPDINILGIEKQAARVGKCLKKILRTGASNAWAVQGEGAGALTRFLPDQSVSVFHLSFPDPWPKRRHASRRVFTNDFLKAIHRCLRPGGVLRLMTDDAEYFLEMRRLTREDWEALPWEDGIERPSTAFEKTFLARGQQPHRCALRPVSRQSSPEFQR